VTVLITAELQDAESNRARIFPVQPASRAMPIASAAGPAAPRPDPTLPPLRRTGPRTGAASGVLITEISGFRPLSSSGFPWTFACPERRSFILVAVDPATRHIAFVTGFAPQGPRAPRRPAGPAAWRAGERQKRCQSGVRQQVRVVEHGAHLRRGMRQSHLRGVRSNGPDGSVVTPIIPSQRAPFHFNADNIELSSVDPGLRSPGPSGRVSWR
jgi:hypothetical protein